MDTFFCLYACCIPVQGFKRSTICDLQRDSYLLIPNEVAEILATDVKMMSVNQIVKELEDDGIWQWLDKLIEKGYGFYTQEEDEFRNFNSIDLTYDEARIITNAIIDFDVNSHHDIKNIFNQLSGLLCETIELRFFYSEGPEALSKILDQTRNTTFRSVEVLVAFNDAYTEEMISTLFQRYPRMNKLTLHSYSDNLFREIMANRMLIFTTQVIDSEVHCGVVSPHLFMSNIFLFTEAQKTNSCLNRKLSIDKFGAIKNCPSRKESYGKINEKKLADIAYSQEFQKVWGISKDLIKVCKDCEFRYMCQDCRAYLKDADDEYSKPLKCNYNPYDATWEVNQITDELKK